MKVSVLISVFSEENPVYFKQAIESIWDFQTMKPFEIILIEDGKLTEGLYEEIRNWKEKIGNSLIIIKNEDNLGLTKSLNIGVEFCKGDFIARMDSDDISSPNRFKLQTDFLLSNPDIDIVGGSIKEFNEFDPCVNIRMYPKSHKEVINFISKASPLAHPSVLFRRNIFDDGNRYCEDYKTSQDIEFWFRLLKKGYKISNISEIALNFRLSNDFAKRRSKKKALNEFKIYWNGILDLYGVSFNLIYPIVRLIIRMLPAFIIEGIYKSNLRNLLNFN